MFNYLITSYLTKVCAISFIRWYKTSTATIFCEKGGVQNISQIIQSSTLKVFTVYNRKCFNYKSLSADFGMQFQKSFSKFLWYTYINFNNSLLNKYVRYRSRDYFKIWKFRVTTPKVCSLTNL